MAIGIDDIDFGDDILTDPDTQRTVNVNPATQQQSEEPDIVDRQPTDEDDLILDLLKNNGIKDPSHIKFEDENGIVSTKNFNDLSRDEQINILSQQTDPNVDLDDDEIELLNAIRSSGLSPAQYAQQLITSNIPQPQQVYTVDDYDDDELFVADLKARSPQLTDDELAQALTQAKSNPEIYQKQVEGIRADYKNLEDQNRYQTAAEQEAQVQQFRQQVINEVDSLNQIGNMDIELDDDDKQELSEFILGRDQAGVSNFGKAINDPAMLTKMAWFALHGDQLLDDIQDYLSDQVKKARQSGYTEGLNQRNNTKQPISVYKPNSQNTKNKPLSINDIDF